jgi:hypothetical protein
MNTKCTLSDEELIAKCQEWVSSLCKTGGQSWCLRVPVSLNTDPDMLFSELAERFQKLLANQHASGTILENSCNIQQQLNSVYGVKFSDKKMEELEIGFKVL